MKKFWYFVIILISGVTIISCVSPEDINEAIEKNPMTNTEYIEFGVETSEGYKFTEVLAIKKFKYDGHSYIWFNNNRGSCSTGGAVHDPECEMCKENN